MVLAKQTAMALRGGTPESCLIPSHNPMEWGLYCFHFAYEQTDFGEFM